GRGPDIVAGTAPFVVAGIVMALLSARTLNTLSLGDDVARALGVRVQLARATSSLAVVVLCGAATAAAGPIGFVGLTVPHVARAAPPPTDRPTARATGVTRAPDGSLVVRVRRGRLSARLDARSVAVTAVALGLATLVFAWSLTLGDYPLSLGDVVRTLVGQGEQRHEFIVRTLRLPRGLTGLLVGASLGLAGAVFQRIMRNPLASPDLIGISNGAAAAAVFVIVVLGGSSTEVTWGALAGAVGTGAAIHLLAYKRGISGYRLVL